MSDKIIICGVGGCCAACATAASGGGGWIGMAFAAMVGMAHSNAAPVQQRPAPVVTTQNAYPSQLKLGNSTIEQWEPADDQSGNDASKMYPLAATAMPRPTAADVHDSLLDGSF